MFPNRQYTRVGMLRHAASVTGVSFKLFLRVEGPLWLMKKSASNNEDQVCSLYLVFEVIMAGAIAQSGPAMFYKSRSVHILSCFRFHSPLQSLLVQHAC